MDLASTLHHSTVLLTFGLSWLSHRPSFVLYLLTQTASSQSTRQRSVKVKGHGPHLCLAAMSIGQFVGLCHQLLLKIFHLFSESGDLCIISPAPSTPALFSKLLIILQGVYKIHETIILDTCTELCSPSLARPSEILGELCLSLASRPRPAVFHLVGRIYGYFSIVNYSRHPDTCGV